jgi:hypothetical protein
MIPLILRLHRLALSWVLTAITLTAGAQTAGPGDDPAAVVRRLFEAMRTKDTAAIRSLFLPGSRLVGSTKDREGAPIVRVISLDDFVQVVARATVRLDERIRDPEVRVDEGLATVWATYELYTDTTFSHCGVDAFQLTRTSEGWKITQVADTRRREGCER